MAIVESFKNFIDVESNIIIGEALVQGTEIKITCINIFHDQCWSLCHWVSHDVNQVNDINSTSKSLQDFNFSSNLGLFHRFKNLDDNSLVIQGVDSLVYFRVLSSSDLLNDFVILLRSIKEFLIRNYIEYKPGNTYPNLTSKFS
jgi:hypothetical protein